MLLETLEVICLLTSFGSEISAKRSLAQHPYVEYISGKSPAVNNNLIEVLDVFAGNSDLVFSVPHDGRTELPSIPERRPGCRDQEDTCRYPGPEDCPEDKVCRVITGPDTNAADIARTVFNKILEITGRTPALVVNHLHRSK